MCRERIQIYYNYLILFNFYVEDRDFFPEIGCKQPRRPGWGAHCDAALALSDFRGSRGQTV
jgi:hypothetical protein